ncbi:MAG: peptidoglycan editing factor PgeF [Geodermatophilaceae bacterium]|nr:peptidoglycan editing factor PgeF [Geodermatophilaceae bacterium]MDQ3475204.1 peptidoglycan editing factor PgeF [Actinomycetota bacterium]
MVTSRPGGVSGAPYDTFNLGDHVGDDLAAVQANRARLARAVDGSSLVWMRQVHGDQVAVIGSSPPPQPPDCDALVTNTRGLALAVLIADCVPVLLADPVAGVIGAAHAGREGVRRHVVARTVEAMVELGATPRRLDALLGPAICGRCYEVSQDLADEVESAAPGGATRTRTEAPGLDLRAALAAQLSRLGVGQVVSDPRCTAEESSLFSYRRDGVTGRQAGVIWLPA